jgi:hypothetical protein
MLPSTFMTLSKGKERAVVYFSLSLSFTLCLSSLDSLPSYSLQTKLTLKHWYVIHKSQTLGTENPPYNLLFAMKQKSSEWHTCSTGVYLFKGPVSPGFCLQGQERS